MDRDISVVIPVFNEAENAVELCATLNQYAKGKEFSLELIFVDDGSSDETCNIIRDYPFEDIEARIVMLSKNFGAHAAMRAGVSRATGKYTMFFSGDLQEPVELIERLYAKMKTGYEVVYVNKDNSNVPASERLLSKMFAKLTRRFVLPNYPLGGVNNIMFDQKVRTVLNQNVESNSPINFQIIDMGFHYAIIDCKYNERKRGSSKWTFGRKFKMFIDSFVSFSYLPIRAISSLGIVMALLGLIWSVAIIVIRVFNIMQLAVGWATLIAICLIGFGVTNMALGISAEYLWRTLDASRKRPVFLIREEIPISHSQRTAE